MPAPIWIKCFEIVFQIAGETRPTICCDLSELMRASGDVDAPVHRFIEIVEVCDYCTGNKKDGNGTQYDCL